MGSEWRKIALGNLVTLQRGHDLPAPDREDGDIPIMGSSGLTGYHNKSKCEGPGVVVGRSGNSMGVVSYCDIDYWPLNTALYVKDFKGNDERYIYYLLSQIDFDQFNSGSAQKSLNRNAVYPFEVLATEDKYEQKELGALLEAYEHKIKLNRQINQTLEQMAQALFKSWFVDFDPVIDNALAAGSPIPDELQERVQHRQIQLAKPDHNPLPDDIRQLFPSEFELTDELGWVPKGWKRKSISELVEVTDYVANGSFAALKENVTLFDEPEYSLYIRTTDYKNGFSLEKAKYVDKQSYDFLKKTRLDGSEIIISNVGDVGTVFTPPNWLGKPMTLGSNAIAIRAKDLKHYIFQYFQGDYGQHQIDGIVGGSAQQKFNKTGFRSLNILVPETAVLSRFNEYAESLKKREHLSLKGNRSLEILRDTLLPKLISGELRLSSEALADAKQKPTDAVV